MSGLYIKNCWIVIYRYDQKKQTCIRETDSTRAFEFVASPSYGKELKFMYGHNSYHHQYILQYENRSTLVEAYLYDYNETSRHIAKK